MKQHTFSILFLVGILLIGVFSSCTDNLTEKESDTVTVDDTNLVETQISLNVAAMNANTVTSTTRADGDDDSNIDDAPTESSPMTDEEKRGTDAERRIDNIWVFQFDATSGKLLITPRYYDISDQNVSPDEENGATVKVLLKPDVESVVYVVANTGDPTWATVENSSKLGDIEYDDNNDNNIVKKEGVLYRTLPNPQYITIGGDYDIKSFPIPMEGISEKVIPQEAKTIKVKVTRMYAKIEISIGYIPETLDITDVQVGNIPYYCQVSSLDLEDENDVQRADYPKDMEWRECIFNPGKKNSEGKYTGTMVIYIPENLQGRNVNAIPDDAGHKTSQAFKDALYLNFIADYKNLFNGGTVEDGGRSYVFYPGANNYSDYNIKRNNIYRVTLDVYTDQYNVPSPSSNCFVVKPGQLLSFLPYYRTEKGGGYNFEDYLNPVGDESIRINDSETMTDNVRIIWQTKDAIGDNTKGDKVWIDAATGTDDDTQKRKIYVRAGEEGNALIGAYNKNGEIIWSWHIWVTNNEPANLSNAVTYSTYAWNETGIMTDVRVPGYAIMSCNLGALANEPDPTDVSNGVSPNTHGMLYQWGRKDPFPPARTGDNVSYDDAHTGEHYGNDNTTLVTKTSGTDKEQLFHSLAGKDISTTVNGDAIRYTIKNPTVFLCGTKEASQSEKYIGDASNYINNGDWNPNHDAKLWGGLEPITGGAMKALRIQGYQGKIAYIFDNYGDLKSIFDPCPSGWRVPPGDLWLGFTDTGYDPIEFADVNTDTEKNKAYPSAGMYLYMTDWKRGETSFFPTQGTRTPDGRIMRTASCGNYHNATTDLNDRVNILHVHNNSTLFHVFETQYQFYYVKSVGGPIRCVRDHK